MPFGQLSQSSTYRGRQHSCTLQASIPRKSSHLNMVEGKDMTGSLITMASRGWIFTFFGSNTILLSLLNTHEGTGAFNPYGWFWVQEGTHFGLLL